MSEKIKVLDLFAGTQSVRKALKGLNIDYKGIDIYSPEGENLILSLSQPFIIEKLKKLLGDWKPDFIWASPVCTPFSRATCIKNGTLSYEIINGELKIRKDFSYITHKAYVSKINDLHFQEKHKAKGYQGLFFMENTIKIIKHFNVPFAIENPANALSKYILGKYFIKNNTNYCMYGFSYKKPTSIYTDKELNLLKCNHKTHTHRISGMPSKDGKLPISGNKERSRVPEKLIQEIFRKVG